MEFVMNYRPVLKNEVPVYRKPMEKLFAEKTVFVFGYGSLLYSDGWRSRGMRVTPKRKDLKECDVTGFKRGPFGVFGYNNYYGVVRQTGADMNGVLVRVHNLQDWVNLMFTECAAGITTHVNYRCVDVTENIDAKILATLPTNAVVHMVCNRPSNKTEFLFSRPAFGYYDRVWASVKEERTAGFQKKFLTTGGFKNINQVYRFIDDLKKRKENKRG